MNFFSSHKIKASRSCTAFLLFLLVAFLCLAGCKDENITIEESFIAAFVEIRVAEHTYGIESPSAGLARRDILKKYGYTRESFIQKTNEILANDDMWIPFQKQVTDRIDSILDPDAYIKRVEAEKAAKEKTKKSKSPKPGKSKKEGADK